MFQFLMIVNQIVETGKCPQNPKNEKQLCEQYLQILDINRVRYVEVQVISQDICLFVC